MRPLTRLSELGAVRGCVYTYGQMTGEAGVTCAGIRGAEVWNTVAVAMFGLRCFLRFKVAAEGSVGSSSVSEENVEKVCHREERLVVGLGCRALLQSSSESELS